VSACPTPPAADPGGSSAPADAGAGGGGPDPGQGAAAPVSAAGLASAALVGAAVSTWGAMCGIGGGLFAVPLLHYVYKLSLRDAIVASLALVAATTISATGAELLHADNSLDWRIVLALMVGSTVGTQLGFRVASVVSARKLKLVFSIALTVVGLRLLGLSPEPEAAHAGAYTIEGLVPRDFWIAGAVGLGGGFVAPLLGIGGGLVAVPALMMLVPALGHLGARACSMAMATFTSTRSIFLYFRAGQLDLSRRSLAFAAGSALGAFAGVQLVHIPGVSGYAEKMLAVTLLLVAARFGLDVVRGGKPSSEPQG
jgi:uncharacterized membrane protein YfcA